jgi:CO/xanthine dehydrogenase Mo-binding subunit
VDEALRLVEIEWEQLPVQVDWDVALKDEVILQPELGESNTRIDFVKEIGDVAAGFAEADHIIEWQEKRWENCVTCVEPPLATAYWQGDHLHYYAKGKGADFYFTTALKEWPISNVHMQLQFMGATFGSGEVERWEHLVGARICCILAKRLGKPVQLQFDEHFWGHDWNSGTYIFKVGFKDDGTIVAVDGEEHCVRNGAMLFEDIEKDTGCKNIREHNIDIIDSRGHSSCHREGGDQVLAANSVYNHVADYLQVDPLVIAMKNHGANEEYWDERQEWRDTHFLEPNRDSLAECIEIGKKAIDWDNKWHLPGTKILPNGRYHGLGLIWSFAWTQSKMASTVGIHICQDGTVAVLGSHEDCGVGADTAYCQVVADEMGMKYEDVTQRDFNFTSRYQLACPGGSCNTVSNVATLVRAARKAKRMLLEQVCQLAYSDPTRAPTVPQSFAEGQPALFPGKTWEELDVYDSVVFEKANPDNSHTVKEICSYYTPGLPYGWGQEPVEVDDHTGPIDWRPASTYQLHMAEVEVDPETGMVYVTKVVNVNDLGKAINPDNVNGQQYGGSYMGVGEDMAEEVYYDYHTGVKLNDNYIGYPIALMNDIGPIDCHIVETRQSYGAYGMNGIGESIGACTYSLIAPAVHNAIGKWVTEHPFTPDRILKALGKI